MDATVLVHSAWLLPVLSALVVADGPFPIIPSEPLLLSAAAIAFAGHDPAAVLGLFVAALVGSMVGDLLVFGLGRSSRRITRETGVTRWVCANIVCRPGLTIVGARFLPAGRLVSTGAAGRYGVSLRRFLPWSLVSAVMWSCYILAIGRLLGPLTGGDPLLSLLAGLAMAGVMAGLFTVCRAVRRWFGSRRHPRARAESPPTPARSSFEV